MPAESQGAKVIPITRGFRRPAQPVPPPPEDSGSAANPLLASLHPCVQALLVARGDEWEVFERGDGILSRVPLPDLLLILKKSAVNATLADLAQVPPILQAPRSPADRPTMQSDRITVSPWPDFDLALMMREGKALYAACLEPGTSIYVAEETLSAVVRYFDGLPEPGT